ncbi:hypothetical protein AB4059_00460 [Lysobacter sp. 2RAF19]
MIRFLAGTPEEWVGNFQRDMTSFDQAVALSDTKHVLVIAGGAAYVVDPATQSIVESFGGHIESCTPTADASGFLLSDSTDIELINGSGRVWRSRRLAWDGLRILEVTLHEIRGEARHFEDSWHPFRVNLSNGQATGGAFPGPGPKQSSLRRRIPTWVFGAASVASALVTAYVFLSAIATASLRFGVCGPSWLDAPDQFCRIGTQRLLLSYTLGAVTLLLVGVTAWLFWRRRIGPMEDGWPASDAKVAEEILAGLRDPDGTAKPPRD